MEQNEAQVLGEKPTVAPTQPTPTVKPAGASQAIAQGFKQEIKPVAKGADAPLTTEIGREAETRTTSYRSTGTKPNRTRQNQHCKPKSASGPATLE